MDLERAAFFFLRNRWGWILECLIDLEKYGIEGGEGVGGGVEWATDDEVGGAGADGGGGVEGALLVVGGSAVGADAWGDDEEVWGEGLAELRELAGGGDDAGEAGLVRELGEVEDGFGGRFGEADGLGLSRVDAGEEGDAEECDVG